MILGSTQNKVDFAIISAIPVELDYINSILPEGEKVRTEIGDFKICDYNGNKVLVSPLGMGTTNAAAMMASIKFLFAPDYFLFAGTAGGINSCLNVGDVVIAASAFEAEIQGAFPILRGTAFEGALIHPIKEMPLQEHYLMDFGLTDLIADLALESTNLPKNIQIHRGIIVTTNTFPSPSSLFKQIQAQKPLALDMETSAIYQTAWLLNTKAIVVRGISNMLDAKGNEDKTQKTDVAGSSKNAGKILLCILDKLIKQITVDS
ncbi:MAG: hypothetical protein A2X47_14175 [Lentisphaerae bacterium GWF2_38_69]|nr:MAG: hypothetical protein A2X47_14175 [Lentisphaerae bacterium GWF2_38_69]